MVVLVGRRRVACTNGARALVFSSLSCDCLLFFSLLLVSSARRGVVFCSALPYYCSSSVVTRVAACVVVVVMMHMCEEIERTARRGHP